MEGGSTSYQQVSSTTSSSGAATTRTVKTTKTTKTEYVVQQSSTISNSSYSRSMTELNVASLNELTKGASQSQTNLASHASLGFKQFGSTDYFQVEQIVEQPKVPFHRHSHLVTSTDISEATTVTSDVTESLVVGYSSRPRLEISDSSQTIVTVEDSSPSFRTMSNTDKFVVTEVVQLPNIVRPRLPRFTTSKTLVETHSFTKDDVETQVVDLPTQTIVETTVIEYGVNNTTLSNPESSATIVEVEATPVITEVVEIPAIQILEVETAPIINEVVETSAVQIVEAKAVDTAERISTVEMPTLETATMTVEVVETYQPVDISRAAQSEHANSVDTCRGALTIDTTSNGHLARQGASQTPASSRLRALSGTTDTSSDMWEIVEINNTASRQHATTKPHPFPPVTRPRTITSTTRASCDIYEVVNTPSTYASPQIGRQNFYPRLSFSQSMGGMTFASASQSEYATTIAAESTEHLWTKYHSDERIPPVPTLPAQYHQPEKHAEDNQTEPTPDAVANSPYLSRPPSATAQHAQDPRQPSRRPSIAVPPVSQSPACWGYCRRGEKGGAQPVEVQYLSLDGMGMFNPLFRILLVALIIVIITLTMAVFLYGYLRMSKIEWTRWIIVSAVPQGSVLLITSLACKIVLICIPFLMAIVAYYIACSWARQNEADAARGGAESGEKLPCGCPIRREVAEEIEERQEMDKEQYGLLLTLFKSATIFALWQGLKYIIKPVSSSSRRKACRQALSRPVVKTLSVLFFALLILYGLLSLDLAMHHLSKTRYLPIRGLALPIPLATQKDAKLYGREIKEACIQDAATNGTACTVSPVTLAAGGVSATANSTTEYAEGMLTLSGLSKTNAIAYTNYTQADGTVAQIALLVDAAATSSSLLAKNEGDDSESWTAKTIGISTKCELISPHCDTASLCSATNSPPTAHLAAGLLGAATIDYDTCTAYSCAASGWPTYWDMGPRNATSLFISEPLESRNEGALYSAQAIPSQSGVARDGGFRFFASLSSYVDRSVLAADCARTSSTTGLCSQGHDEGFVYAGDNVRARVGSYRQVIMGCSVQVLDVEYDYFQGEYTIHNSSVVPANSTHTYALSSVLYTSDARVGALGAALGLLAAGKTASSAGVTSALEAGVGRVMLAMGHCAFVPSSVTALRMVLSVPATIMPAPLVAGFIALLVIFAILVIVVAAFAVLHINRGLWAERKRVEKAMQQHNHDTGCST